MSTLLMFIKLGQFSSSQFCGPEGFENSVYGPGPKVYASLL